MLRRHDDNDSTDSTDSTDFNGPVIRDYALANNRQISEVKRFLAVYLQGKSESYALKKILMRPENLNLVDFEIREQRLHRSINDEHYHKRNSVSECLRRRIRSFARAALRVHYYWDNKKEKGESYYALESDIDQKIFGRLLHGDINSIQLENVVKVMTNLLKKHCPTNSSSDLSLERALITAENLINWVPDSDSFSKNEQKTVITISQISNESGSGLTAVQVDMPRKYYTKALCQEWFGMFLKNDHEHYPDWLRNMQSWECHFWKDTLLNLFKKTLIHSQPSETHCRLTIRNLDFIESENFSKLVEARLFNGSDEIESGRLPSEWTEEQKNIVIDIIKPRLAEYAMKTLFLYLDSCPSTCRAYPGLSNYREHTFLLYNVNGELIHEDSSYRASVIVPYEMDSKSKVKNNMTVQKKHTLLSITQFIEQQIINKEDDASRMNFYFPTFLSPTRGPDKVHQEAQMLKRKNEALSLFDSDTKQYGLITQNNISSHMMLGKINHIFKSNTPLNQTRPGQSLARLSKNMIPRETHSILFDLYKWSEKNISYAHCNRLAILTETLIRKKDLSWDDDKLDTAFSDLEDLTIDKNVMLCKLAVFYLKLLQRYHSGGEKIRHDRFALLFVAAEELLFSKLNYSTLGTCKSGKDRRGVTLLYKDALSVYFWCESEFPPLNMKSKKYTLLNAIISELFISGHQQRIAELNSVGCYGLKSLSEVIPKDAYTYIDMKYQDIFNHNKVVSSFNRLGGGRQIELSKITHDNQELKNKIINILGLSELSEQEVSSLIKENEYLLSQYILESEQSAEEFSQYSISTSSTDWRKFNKPKSPSSASIKIAKARQDQSDITTSAMPLTRHSDSQLLTSSTSSSFSIASSSIKPLDKFGTYRATLHTMKDTTKVKTDSNSEDKDNEKSKLSQ